MIKSEAVLKVWLSETVMNLNRPIANCWSTEISTTVKQAAGRLTVFIDFYNSKFAKIKIPLNELKVEIKKRILFLKNVSFKIV